ncbi:hypothetical protein NA57DRAFT_66698 [Rhizodiscina lignyota]|uniref:Guanine nucleotide exchange factor n=1 Tax=Rhizodiscina lignyota TaxID=1504668 RepID=A0A9P4IFH9_9PEZI|nr:hypothetical protein NA57DRAFT_66698 [Rhizodiscina lignyota]
MALTARAPSFTDSSTSPKKREEVEELLQKLRIDLEETNLLPLQRTASLEQLKVFSRDVKDADALYTREAIETLGKHSFDSNSLSTSREALRCLANIFLLNPPTRQMFVDLGFGPKAAERLKVDNRDDEFLVSRILFLMTYNTNLNFEKLVNDNQLADSINQPATRKSSTPDPMNAMALAETLKLMFNINHFYPDLAGTFLKSLTPLLKMLHRTKITSPALQPPVNYIINALTNLDFEDKRCGPLSISPLFPKFDQTANADHLIHILGRVVDDYKDSELDASASPVLALVRKVYEIAPENVRKYMESLLLPSDEERSLVLGKSDTLAAKLLRLSTSPMLPNLRTSIQAMMFELSGKDASKFVRNVGYGFASGFLMSNGISIPANAMEAYSNGDSSSSTRASTSTEHASSDSNFPINPITGQRLDAEAEVKDDRPPMTDEEKEREAERLFVLFERLKATGIMDVENPVRTAVESGRIEELPD